MTSAASRVALFLSAFALVAGCRSKAPETRFTLDDGLRVELAPLPGGDQVALVVLFDVGADHDPPGRSGMAHLVERLFATEGRAGKPDRTVQTRTGGDFTFYGLAVPAARLMDEIDDTAARMSTLAPTDADLARERPRLLEQVRTMQERDPMMAAMNRASEALRPSAGGGVRGGIAAEIEKMTLPEIESFRRAHYGASTARLVIAGRFDVAEVSKRIRKAFAAVPAGKAPAPRAPVGSRVTGTLVMGDLPSAVALAVPVPDPKDPRYAAFVVLATRLSVHAAGGDAQAQSQAWKSNFAPFARPDVLLVTSAIPKDQPAELFAEKMRADVSGIVAKPLEAAEHDHAMTKFGGVLGLRPAAMPLETAFALGRRLQLGIDAKALEQAIKTVTQEQITAAAPLFDVKNSAAVITGGKT